MMRLLEIQGYDVASSTIKTRHYSDRNNTAFSPSDADRPNQFYRPRIDNFGRYKRTLFGTGRTYGHSSSNTGTITLSNPDGKLDYLMNWSFSGRQVKVYKGEESTGFSGFELIISATIKDVTFNKTEVSVTLVDKESLFDKPIARVLYAGTNTGESGDEGLEGDIKGHVKPLGFGKIFNAKAILCNAAAHRYQVHNGPIDSISNVYDKGVALTYNASPTAAGEYSVNLTTGIITLFAKPAGVITVDFYGYVNTSYVSTVADLVKEIAIEFAGVDPIDIDTASFDQVNTDNSATVGQFVTSDSTTIKSVVDKLCSSIGAGWFFNALGKLVIRTINEPKAVADHDIADYYPISVKVVKNSDDQKGVPVHSVSINYAKNESVQDESALAGSISQQRRAELNQQYRVISVDDTEVKTVYLSSEKMTRQTALTDQADANSEASRLLALYRVKRQHFIVELPDQSRFDAIDLLDTVNLSFRRFGLSAGKNMVVMGIERESPDMGKIQLEVWG